MAKRDILVTNALLYANGSLHLGHLVGYIQTDIWARFQRMRGHQCLYICGDDAHGTPIMLKAQQQGITPEQLIDEMGKEHRQDFSDFHVAFDNYYTTHSDENKQFTETIYQRLKQRGDIISKTIKQAFDPKENMFLPDRFVKGTCPRCKAEDQYGDNCEACGATYSPTDLINPVSAISGATPIEKESEHFFFNLTNYTDLLKDWTHNDHLQEQVTNKLKEWFETGLQAWDISRDAPYFGFEIPDAPGKYFYVWLDAPVGYMASLKNLCTQRDDLDFERYWGKDSEAELYHFIGKDIIYFHSLFWPAMLHGADFRKPSAIFVNGFLTVNGQKMSKSRGTFIKARTYLDYLDPEYLRYYYAAKLNSCIEDIDLNLQDFSLRVNSDLVGKVVNIASRCAGFISKRFQGKLADKCIEPELYQQFVDASEKITNLYEKREFSHAVREIMALADIANQYINDKQPWALAKQEGQEKQVQQICTLALNLFRVLTIYLKPILPKMAEKVETFLNIEPMTWEQIEHPLVNHSINRFKPLLSRIDPEKIAALQESATEK